MVAVLIGRLLGAGLLDAIEANLARTAAGMAIRELAEGEAEGEEPLKEITVPVHSTAIRSIGWRSDNTITVEFMERGTYTYDGSFELFTVFVNAPSKGRFFNEHFK
jgi:hypothetical protein